MRMRKRKLLGSRRKQGGKRRGKARRRKAKGEMVTFRERCISTPATGEARTQSQHGAQTKLR